MPFEDPPTADEQLELNDIQGNILVGFKGAHQALLFLKVDDDAVEAFRSWLASAVSSISSAKTVLASRRATQSADEERLSEPTLTAGSSQNLNIAFSHAILKRMTRGRKGDLERNDFRDEAFKSGMAARSVRLGDPRNPTREGHISNWLLGGTQNPVDCLIIVADNDKGVVARRVQALETKLPSGVRIVHRDLGERLSGEREHFGYRDGISQPGIRGFVGATSEPLTPRSNPGDPSQGRPGQDLIWPGEFVFGYYSEDPTGVAKHAGKKLAGPEWSKNGSYLVFRRLRQKVAAFRAFVAQNGGANAERAGAQMVGRWTSGAPLVRAPNVDVPELGRRPCVNNHFGFQTATAPLPDAVVGSGACSDALSEGRRAAAATADNHGQTCPFSAHIRKAYARDDQPVHLARSRRLLRRGIPYGKPVTGDRDDAEDRGLLFLAYQTSFEHQFEAVTRQLNDPNFIRPGAGHDAIAGAVSRGDRTFRVGDHMHTTSETWVVPTGGEYFFSPSISALQMLSQPNTKAVHAMPKPNELGSFLAFLYNIRFNPDYRTRFTWPQGYDRSSGILPQQQNAEPHSYVAVMDEFKLTPAQRDLMVAVDWAMESKDPMERTKADELWKQLVLQLIPEFRAWTEGNYSYGVTSVNPPAAAAQLGTTQPFEPEWW